LVPAESVYPLPRNFDFEEYIETERELWALFPETDGRRVNFVQLGLTASVYAEVPDDGSELLDNEIYLLMPFSDRTLRPIRMTSCRRLTLAEYRMGQFTALKLTDLVTVASAALHQIGREILGPEVLEEAELRMRGNHPE
jgi:hypothetical protein